MIDSNDPRVIMFKMNALKNGMSPEAVDAFVNEQLQKENQTSLKEDISLRTAQANLDEKLEPTKTPTQLGEEQAQIEIVKQKKLGEAGMSSEQSSATVKLKGMGKSGIDAVDEAEKMYDKDKSLLFKQIVPGHFFSRKFDSALYNAVDVLLRLRTGAQANPSEIRGYMERIGPSFGDNYETAKYKIKQLRKSIAESTGITQTQSQGTGDTPTKSRFTIIEVK